MEKQVKNQLRNREKRLQKIESYSEIELQELWREVQEEHQKLITAEAGAEAEEMRVRYHSLVLLNEQQGTAIQEQLGRIYQKKAAEVQPKALVKRNLARAFLVGGLICGGGQVILNFLMAQLGLEMREAAGLVSVVVVVLTALLTGLGIYDEIGRFGGAGCTVPISGFANSIVSAAMEFRREGLIYGVGAKIFTVAGPVILYGTIASVAVGIIYYWLG